MSEFHVEVVRLGKIGRHPQADTLEITTVRGGYTVIFKENQYKEGDMVVFVPEDAMVPLHDERWDYLRPDGWTPVTDGLERTDDQKSNDKRFYTRIKAARLRSIFSMGVITPAELGWTEGQNVQSELSVLKYEPFIPVTGGDNEKDPGFLPVYTDIESMRRWGDMIVPGEEVVLTEKIHGCNGRWLFNEDRLWVGSHGQIKRDEPSNLWWVAARTFDLAGKLSKHPGIAIYGEVFGQVQKGYEYGIQKGKYSIALFDAMDIKTRRYFDYDEFVDFAKSIDMPVVPTLFRGAWDSELIKFSNGPTTVPGGVNRREGFVCRPVKERWDQSVGRVVLKYVGEEYLLKKK